MFQSSVHPRLVRFVSSCWLLLDAAACAPATGQPVSAAAAGHEGPEPVVVTVFTDHVQLFMEYPRLVQGQEARFLAHLTVLASGEPVRSGQLRLELSGGPNSGPELAADEPTRDGLFIPVGTFDVPGQYDARIVVTGDQVNETIPLAPLLVHADLASAFAAAEADAREELPDTVPLLLEQQWAIGLLTEQVERRTLVQRLQVPGEIEAPYEAQAVASAPLAGRLLRPESGRLPRLGQHVEQGQVLAFLEPPLTASDTAQLVANASTRAALEMELLVRELDLRAKSLEIEQALQLSQTRLDFARQSLARIEGLRAQDLGTVAELQAAQRDVEIALRGSAGAEALRESFAQARAQLEELRRSAAARAAGASEHRPRHPVVAPIAGEIVGVDHVEGEHVESQGALYRLLDASRVWVAAHVSEFDLAEIGQAPGARIELAAYPERTFDVLGEMGGSLVHVGRVLDPDRRTLTLRYEVANPDGLFRTGMFVDVFLETQRAVDALALPQDAIVMDNGQPVAFVLLHGEAFQKRVLELGTRDGGFVEVRDGIGAGERVVTQGAYLVKLASAAPASFGEGHVH